MKISYRLYAAVAPSVVGVMLVAALSYWGQYAHTAPASVIIIAAVAVVGSLVVAWRNTRYVIRRVERLAAIDTQLSSVNAAATTGPFRSVGDVLLGAGVDEIDAIGRALETLEQNITTARAETARVVTDAEQRAHEYATLIADVSTSVEKRIEESRMPLHILLTAQFGDLNDNQEEMLGTAESALEELSQEVRRLHTIAEIDRGMLTIAKESVHIGTVLRSLYPMLHAQADQVGARLTLDVEPALPRVQGDVPRLREALRLAIADDIRYAGPGNTVTVAARSTPTTVMVTVQYGASYTGAGNIILAERLIRAQGGTLTHGEGRTTISMPRGL